MHGLGAAQMMPHHALPQHQAFVHPALTSARPQCCTVCLRTGHLWMGSQQLYHVLRTLQPPISLLATHAAHYASREDMC